MSWVAILAKKRFQKELFFFSPILQQHLLLLLQHQEAAGGPGLLSIAAAATAATAATAAASALGRGLNVGSGVLSKNVLPHLEINEENQKARELLNIDEAKGEAQEHKDRKGRGKAGGNKTNMHTE
ncbi:hypothetical protein ACSSS7_002358 [Eimeria intestinalis]